MALAALLDRLLGPPSDATWESVTAFRGAWLRATEGLDGLAAAAVGGALADRLGYAFAAGYDAALHALVADLPRERAACLCVTEAGGNHPRAIETALKDGRLDGEKAWTTLADAGDVLLVAASAGRDGDRNRLVLVRVPADAPGVTRVAMPPTPFVPEIPHFRMRFEAVPVAAEQVLPGDGWTDWVKPFRTVEDLHVLAAAAGYLLRVAGASGWPGVLRERLAGTIAVLHGLAATDSASPGAHLALASALASLKAAAADAPWDTADPDTASRWRRDHSLLSVAGKARAARTARAHVRLGAAPVESS